MEATINAKHIGVMNSTEETNSGRMHKPDSTLIEEMAKKQSNVFNVDRADTSPVSVKTIV